MALKKYRLKNVKPGQTQLFSGILGYVSLNHLTDEEADILYQNGQSHYLELITAEEIKEPPAEKQSGETLEALRKKFRQLNKKLKETLVGTEAFIKIVAELEEVRERLKAF